MSNYIIHNGTLMSEELYHYGVKGMKWGVRKARKEQRKEIRLKRRKYEADEYKRLTKKYDISGKENAAYEYGRKHGLDLDDGGGGSAKAGQKYMKMWDDIEALDTRAMNESKKYARKKISEEFGEQTILDLERHDTSVSNAKALVAISGLMAVPLATVVGLIATDPNLRK